ncbi:unnamed protein product [Tilletia controversa]|uniref:Guanine nucleotide-binding protein subunit alpha n=1 Tax=Tilletia controversa TaxID=13291 RepID=A0A8X7MK88_9BASI|nr:hypothetical protein CF328_g7697 [Tilletia controversa]KAE8239275.1 hypothetical protein A4X06_0g8393 [Tilletia controversa]CAD6935402.1 unnamed protein product [Tilletia controversa]CAD6941027.1 unnamed protein product [Tilletia controversa]CAD6975081.1 unnamed protein product [Tilletia controversa]
MPFHQPMMSSRRILSQLGLSQGKAQKSPPVAPDLTHSTADEAQSETESGNRRLPRRVTAAQARSDEIDRRLRRSVSDIGEPPARQQQVQQPDLSILLLGQQGAGKTTLLKQMRLLYDPEAHERERHGWRLVIFLNIITAARIMLERIEQHEDIRADGSLSTCTAVSFDHSTAHGFASDAQSSQDHDLNVTFGGRSLIMQAINSAPGTNRSRLTSLSEQSQNRPFPSALPSSTGHQLSRSAATRARTLRLRLAPLLTLERELREELGAIGDDVDLSGNAVLSGSVAWAQRIPIPSHRAPAMMELASSQNDSVLLLKPGWQRKFAGEDVDSQATLADPFECEVKGSDSVGSAYSLLALSPPSSAPPSTPQLQTQTPLRSGDLSVPTEEWHRTRARSNSNASEILVSNRQSISTHRPQMSSSKSIPSFLSKAMGSPFLKGPSTGSSGSHRDSAGRASTDGESADEPDHLLSSPPGSGKSCQFKRSWRRQRTQSTIPIPTKTDRIVVLPPTPLLPPVDPLPSERGSEKSDTIELPHDGARSRSSTLRPRRIRRASGSSIDEMLPSSCLVPQTAPPSLDRFSSEFGTCERSTSADSAALVGAGTVKPVNSSSADLSSWFEESEQEMLRDTYDSDGLELRLAPPKTTGLSPRRTHRERTCSSGSSNCSTSGQATPRSISVASHNLHTSPPSFPPSASLSHFGKFSPTSTWDDSSCASSVHSDSANMVKTGLGMTLAAHANGSSDSDSSNVSTIVKLGHERTGSSSEGSDRVSLDACLGRDSSDRTRAHTSQPSTSSSVTAFHTADSTPKLKMAAEETTAPTWRRKAGRDLKRKTSVDDPAVLLAACKDEILSLWRDPIVVRHRRMGGAHGESDVQYLIKNLDRIASTRFEPTDEDIMHARVRTLGVIEERLRIHPTLSCRIFDVGGSTYHRKAWSPFFDNRVDSFIFLAPLSAYNQTLNEDPTVNRLQDSLALFKSIVDSPLLRRASVILFLNKIDILRRKLNRAAAIAGDVQAGSHRTLGGGIVADDGPWVEDGEDDDSSFSDTGPQSPYDNDLDIRNHFPDYTGDPHSFEDVWHHFRDAFLRIAASAHYPATLSTVTPSREVYVHPTVAVDRLQIGAILRDVMDEVLESHLTEITLL